MPSKFKPKKNANYTRPGSLEMINQYGPQEEQAPAATQATPVAEATPVVAQEAAAVVQAPAVSFMQNLIRRASQPAVAAGAAGIASTAVLTVSTVAGTAATPAFVATAVGLSALESGAAIAAAYSLYRAGQAAVEPVRRGYKRIHDTVETTGRSVIARFQAMTQVSAPLSQVENEGQDQQQDVVTAARPSH